MRRSLPMLKLFHDAALLLLAWMSFSYTTHAATPPSPQAQPIVETQRRLTVSLEPMLALSEDKELPSGGGLAGQFMYSPTDRMSMGVFSSWSKHNTEHFLRAAVGIQFLLDDLPILPFLQTSVGLQMRLGTKGPAFTADLHLGAGVEVPIPLGFRLGFAYHMIIPLQIALFPISKSLHLRWSLVF